MGRDDESSDDEEGNGSDMTTEEVKYYHGGVSGLKPKDRIRCSRSIGLSPLLAKGYTCDPEKVYVTTDYDVARSYAAHYGRIRSWTYGGDVYQVQTVGEVLPDPDYDGVGDAFSCGSARVKRAMVRRVSMTDEQLTRINARHQLYPDGTPVYDVDGFLLPSEGNRRDGHLPEDLRISGRVVLREEQHVVLERPCAGDDARDELHDDADVHVDAQRRHEGEHVGSSRRKRACAGVRAVAELADAALDPLTGRRGDRPLPGRDVRDGRRRDTRGACYVVDAGHLTPPSWSLRAGTARLAGGPCRRLL